MFNSLLHQHDRITTLQSLLTELKTKGTISMESADLIERLVPGEIRELDSDIIFDIDESEEGLPVAMEAALAGMSKLKIAFIVAIIAFISRYILSLNNNSYNFSASAGGGGWGGSAPPKFTTNKPPSSVECQQEIDEYQHLINEDIKTLRSNFQTVYAEFTNGNYLETSTKTKSIEILLNDLIPKIIEKNLIKTDDVSKPFLFSKVKNNTKAETVLDYQNWNSFDISNIDRSDLSKGFATRKQQSKKVLDLLNAEYNLTILLNNYAKSNENDELIKKLGIPYFLINPKIQSKTLEFMQFIIKTVDRTSNLENALDDFLTILPETSKAFESSSGLSEIKPLWKWLSDHLGKNTTNQSAIKAMILELDKVLGEGLSDEDSPAYYNTNIRAAETKKFVSKTLTGYGGSGKDADEIKGMQVTDGELVKFIEAYSSGELSKILNTSFLDLNEEISDELKKSQRSIESINKLINEIEQSIMVANEVFTNNIGKDQEHAVKTAMSGQEAKRNQTLTEYDEDTFNKHDAEAQKVKQHYPKMLNLVSGLVRLILLITASGAKYNIDMGDMVKIRCKLVLETSQNIASDYYELIKVLSSIMERNFEFKKGGDGK